ncbi:hypothetical protein QL285_021518 [Trifolium repens]|nr:hypothetical protein QL285_021518 [Trifolium repens]
MRQTKNSFTIKFYSATECIHLLCLITGILQFEYDPEPERTFWKRRRAQKLAESSNLITEEEPANKSTGDEQRVTMGDYCDGPSHRTGMDLSQYDALLRSITKNINRAFYSLFNSFRNSRTLSTIRRGLEELYWA